MKNYLLIFLSCLLVFSCNNKVIDETGTSIKDGIALSVPYLGQELPDTTAKLFAPGVISTGLYERDIAITPDEKEIYFCISSLGYNLIFYTKEVDGKWTEPALAEFIKNYEYMYYEPCISHDGKKMFFLSTMPKDSTSGENEDIWVVDRQGNSWGKPYNLGEPICTENSEFFPSITNDGTIYFTRQAKGSGTGFIFRSKLVEGQYTEPEMLPKQVNCGTNRFNAYVNRDEKFIIVPAMGVEENVDGVNYYIVYRNADDTWAKPINMGEQINSKNGRAWSPYISPDGKYLFFMSSRSSIDDRSKVKPSHQMFIKEHSQPGNGNSDIYWISTKILDELKPSS